MLGSLARSRKPILTAALTVCAALSGREAGAQGLPFHTPTALPLPLAESGLRSFYRHAEMRSLLVNGEEVPNIDGVRVGIDAVPVILPHGVTPRTIVFVGVPYVRKAFEQAGASETNGGLGDAFIRIKHELLGRDFVGGNRRLALFANVSLPTGQTEEDGLVLAPPLRLGLGVVDVAGRAVYSYVNDRVGAHGAVGYAAAAGTIDGVRPGDRFLYDLAFGYRVVPAVYGSMNDVTLGAYLELNGVVQQPGTRGDALTPNAGGHTLFVSPGLQVIPRPNLAVEASFQYPLVRALHGTQLGPDWVLSIGFRTVFYLFGL